MKRKKIFLHILYFIIFLLFFVAEKNLGIRAFSLACFFALVYCRQNALILCPTYAIASMLITPTINNLIFALLPCGIILLAYLAHYKSKKKIAPIFLSIYAFLAQIPLVILYNEDVYQLTNTIISILGTQMFMYCCIAFLHPTLTRGWKYKLRHEESLAFFVFCTIVFLSVSYLRPFEFSILSMIGVSLILTIKQTHYTFTALAATSIGLGGAIAMQGYFPFVIFVLIALIAMAFKEINIYITSIGVLLGIFVINYFFYRGFDIMEIAPYLAGAIIIMFMPRSYFKAIKTIGGSSIHNLATRTLANRDRNQVARRLLSLSNVFYEIQDILQCDLEEKKNNNDEKIITRDVYRKCCHVCTFREDCIKKMGDPSFAISNLVKNGMANTKVTLLNVLPVLVNNCKRINTLLNTINDTVAKFRKKRQAEESIEQGREMIISQMGGVGLLLNKLSEDMQLGIRYDMLLEKKIFEELCKENIITNDVVVYGRDRAIDRIMLNINESHAENKVIPQILSILMDQKMIEIRREKSIKNNIIIHFAMAPKYDVVYGDKEISKIIGQHCGDSRKAGRISQDKLMLILADGMGSGQDAHHASMNAISMIESFYKAGFDHDTILACVGRLLGLREQEECHALDIVVVDTKTGKADFIKQGGRESFILSDGNVEVVSCGSLPLGIIEDSYPLMEQHQLVDGDIVVLASDGILDCLGEDLIKEILITSNTVNPQIFAELIVNNADRISEEKGIRDDMSCIVGRIVEYK